MMVTPGNVYRDAATSWATILGDPKGLVIALSMMWFLLKIGALFYGFMPYYYIDPIMIPLIVLFTSRSYYSVSSLPLLKDIEKISIRIGRKTTLLVGLLTGLLLTYVGNSVFWLGYSSFPGAFFVWLFIAFTDMMYLYCATTLGMILANDSSSSTEKRGIVLVLAGVVGGSVMLFITIATGLILLGGIYSFILGMFCSLSAIGVPFLKRRPNAVFWIAFLIVYILSFPKLTGFFGLGVLTPFAVSVAALAGNPGRDGQLSD